MKTLKIAENSQEILTINKKKKKKKVFRQVSGLLTQTCEKCQRSANPSSVNKHDGQNQEVEIRVNFTRHSKLASAI